MSVGTKVLPMGEAAVLVEVETVDEVVALGDALRTAVRGGEAPWDTVTDVVPAARTVLLTGTGPLPVSDVEAAVRRLVAGTDPTVGRPAGEHVEIPVRYDGEDLTEVASLTGLSETDVVAAHTGSAWTVAFDGFAPGFAYLVGGDPRLRVPRRTDPRTRVPAGAVALAGEFSAVYPRESPGGWQLIGRTDAVLWDLAQDPPARLTPGTQVRFVDVTGAGR